MVICSAFGCRSRTERRETGVTFHRFPKDLNRRKQWVTNMKINWIPTTYDRICSKHFENRFLYKTDGELKVRLLNQAAPTLFEELPKNLQPKELTKQACTSTPESNSSAVLPEPDSTQKLCREYFQQVSESRPRVLSQSLKSTNREFPGKENIEASMEPVESKIVILDETIRESIESVVGECSYVKSEHSPENSCGDMVGLEAVAQESGSNPLFTRTHKPDYSEHFKDEHYELRNSKHTSKKNGVPNFNFLSTEEITLLVDPSSPELEPLKDTEKFIRESSDTAKSPELVENSNKIQAVGPYNFPKGDFDADTDYDIASCSSREQILALNSSPSSKPVHLESMKFTYSESASESSEFVEECLKIEIPDGPTESMDYNIDVPEVDTETIANYELDRDMTEKKNSLLSGNVCRVCLKDLESLVPIDKIYFMVGSNSNGSVKNMLELSEVFYIYCNIKVHKKDGKPQQICEPCKDALYQASNILQQFTESNTLLDNILCDNQSGEIDLEGSLLRPLVTSNTTREVEDNDDNDPVTYVDRVKQEGNCLEDEGTELDDYKPQVPFFVIDPKGSLGDHNYSISENRYLARCKKQQKRKREGRSSPRKEKPPKVDRQKLRQELRKKRKKFEEDNDLFRCKLCKKMFDGIAKVLEHLSDEHADSKRCILCPQKIKREKYMMYHVASHSKYGLICKICRIYFKDKELLEQHNVEVDHSAAILCHLCLKTFKLRSIRKRHIEEVHRQNSKPQYQCVICGLILKWRQNLIRHERTHQDISKRKLFLCQICAKSFSTKFSLEVHVKIIHEGQEHLRIKLKGKKYFEKRRKKMNDREIKKETYECQFCPRKLATSSALFTHEKCHSESRSIKCPYCEITCEDVESYERHRNVDHCTFVCSICEKGFPSKKALSSHSNMHIKKYKCVICFKRFDTALSLKSHKFKHTGERPYKCEYCDKAFRHPTTLNQHIKCLHTKKIHKCPICDKAFLYMYNVKAHMRTHTGEKPFACLYCDKRFRDTLSRHKHVRRDHSDKMEDFLEYKKSYQQQESKAADGVL